MFLARRGGGSDEQNLYSWATSALAGINRNGALQFSLCSILKPASHESIKIIRFLERKAPLVYSKVIEDITWPRGETKFLFEC